MAILDLFKKKEKKQPRQSPEQKVNNAQVRLRHERRILNLKDELEMLSNSLEEIELDTNLPKVTKSKQSDSIIRRIALIKYEIGVREDLIKWL